MVRAGLTPMQALTIATRDAAALMHLDDRGTIAAGKRADLVVLGRDPSRDIGAVDDVIESWIAGQPQSAR
jgi:imidazolonepropionase-like amidohydrolase